ncbi:MAG: insulinase family protein, partial [Bacteroidales bacterium]|nr:insulinase family protein [Bacteroidales bacterium]
MKRTLLIFAAMLCAAHFVFAQTIPDDPDFRIGRLDNGLSYYLCHNEKPEGCAEFYIAHNVGALQEEDNQDGLAHFLEHMAFNGTRHYPGKGILDFLAKEGVRFGYNVNAFTTRTETVYNLSEVPLVRDSFVDSVLMVLHDWSCDISCEQQALDDERGVISEEWRFRNDPRSRMAKRQNELVYKGSKYALRDVIGKLEVINGFERH